MADALPPPVRDVFRALAVTFVPEAAALDERGWTDAFGIVENALAPRPLPGKVAVTAAHLMGGCGMGRTRADSVTDAWGRVHGIPWLRVADASLFPDSLEINPYLSIMAVADRVAETVREEAAALLA